MYYFACRWNAFYDALSFMAMNLEKINMICIDLSIPCLVQIETNFLIEYCKVCTYLYQIIINSMYLKFTM